MGLILLTDFGSTYTKVVAVNREKEEIVATAQAPSTSNCNINIGLQSALDKLRIEIGTALPYFELKLACSSAGGGLRVVVIGLVRELTTDAAKRTALGAGAKVIASYSHGITHSELAELESLHPDIVLLTGGTDGGDRGTIVANATVLAKSELSVPVIIAGNKSARDEVTGILKIAGKPVVATENVMPELGKLNAEPARSTIREVFLQHVVQAKGLQDAQRFLTNIIMPTPMAVLNAATLLAQGTKGEAGMGKVVIVDVGGATTDVYSITGGTPTRAGVLVKGLPELYAKRTVEGDLGIRSNAYSILQIAGKKTDEHMLRCNLDTSDINMEQVVQRLSSNTAVIPETDAEFAIDSALARAAVDIAMARHAGTIEAVYTLGGITYVQFGKDLTNVEHVIGTGGIFAYGRQPREILEAVLFNKSNPLSLRPKCPSFYIDKKYILYAMGLLADIAPPQTLRIMKKYLQKI
jgi:uncharacterized protein (TIGR01319 family)